MARDEYDHLRESADVAARAAAYTPNSTPDAPCVVDGSHTDDIAHAYEYANGTGRHERRAYARTIVELPDGTLVDDAAMRRFIR